jgi:hypothetical protein
MTPAASSALACLRTAPLPWPRLLVATMAGGHTASAICDGVDELVEAGLVEHAPGVGVIGGVYSVTDAGAAGGR